MTTIGTPPLNSVGKSVRRFIVVVLLFVLVTIAAIGIAGLFARFIDSSRILDDGDTFGLATFLAFSLIAGPIAAVLWWFTWRGLGDPAERDSVLWGLYLAGMATVALIVSVVNLLSAICIIVSGHWESTALTTGVVWAGVWVWHRWMARHRTKAPTRLVGGARILGYAFGIAVGAIAGVDVLSTLIHLAVEPTVSASPVGLHLLMPVLQSAIWVVVGVLVWWVNWTRDGGAQLRTGFATVMLVLVTGLVAVGLALWGAVSVVYVVLRVIFERDIPVIDLVEPLGLAVGTASVGAVLWAYFRQHLRAVSSAAQFGSRLVAAGLALGTAASGVGIVINSILATLAAPLAESDSRGLLFAGLSALIVGGPAWWVIWKPLAPVTATRAREPGRRVYLITVFGISALVAIITLLVIGFQVFQFALTNELDGSLVDRIRVSLGLFVATALVGIYHFSVWRRDRSLVPTEAARPQTIGRVMLVAGADRDAAVRAIRDATGATVTVLTRTDSAPSMSPTELVAALEGVTGSLVLVISGENGLQVIPLQG